jgi:hypothetical protein
MTTYATLAQVKNALRLTDNIDDLAVQDAINAASEMVEGYCGRTFGTATAVRLYAADDSEVVQIDDLVSLTELKTASSSISGIDTVWTSGYQLEPLNGFVDGKYWPSTRIRAIGRVWPINGQQALIRVTGIFGWSAVPASVTQATIIQASRLFKRNESPMGVAGYGDMGVMRITSKYLDGDVTQLLDVYRMVRSVA